MKATQIYYEGSVQGVGFRYTAKRLAQEYDVIGSVRNLPDGRVELIVSGDSDEVEAFLSAIRDSTLAGHIQREERSTIVPAIPLKGFQIVP